MGPERRGGPDDGVGGAQLVGRHRDRRPFRQRPDAARGDPLHHLRGREAAANRDVVIKIPDESGAPWLREILEHEAEVLASIGAHPNVVTFYQRFALEDGRPALVLEYCPSSLDDALRGDAAIPLERVTSMGIALAGALETVHRSGVLHCDVRPDNILITEFGEAALAGFDEAVAIDSGVGIRRCT